MKETSGVSSILLTLWCTEELFEADHVSGTEPHVVHAFKQHSFVNAFEKAGSRVWLLTFQESKIP
jgi:hypothetical protein